MKLTGGRIEAFLRSPDPRIRAVLIYGADAGQVRERADALTRTVAGTVDDPFRVAEVPAADLRRDPSILADEMAALSLTGGRRAVRLRSMDDAVASPVLAVLDATAGDTLLVVEAGELGPRSALRKGFEAAEAAAALPCYVAESADILRLARDMAAEHGKTLDRDAEDRLVSHLETDRQLARREIEKLITYVGAERRIDADAVAACIGDRAEQTMDELVFEAAEGDAVGLDRCLAKVLSEGTPAVAVLRAAQRHFARLHLVVLHCERGATPDDALAKLRPPVFFKAQPRFRAQLSRWRRETIERALDLLVTAEADGKRTGMPAETLCERALGEIAALARAEPKRRSLP